MSAAIAALVVAAAAASAASLATHWASGRFGGGLVFALAIIGIAALGLAASRRR